MRIICPIKRVPDTAADKRVNPDGTLDRDASEAVLNANDEWAIEEALRIRERGVEAELIALCVGPEAASATVRKALSYGLDAAIHVSDPAIKGSDAPAIARVLAAALRGEDVDLVLMGNQSSDARTMLVPAMLAELLDMPALTYAKRLEVDGDVVRADRETPTGHQTVQARLPAVVSVVEAINQPRYPSFKGIMAAKSKPVSTRTLADVGVDADEVGLANAWTQVLDVTVRPPKEPGRKVVDDGSGLSGARALADFLVERKFI